MSFLEVYSSKESVPNTIAEFLPDLPMDEQNYQYLESPRDWSDEVLYFLLPDRFSNEDTTSQPLLRIDAMEGEDWEKQKKNWLKYLKNVRGQNWNWENWTRSGGQRFQGGTLKGMKQRLSYLKNLGITAIWVGPIFKQRDELNTYHGYGIQNFLDVDPRFGTRADLVDFVKAAHKEHIRIILDIVFNHSGSNFWYPQNTPDYKCYNENGELKAFVDGENQAEYKYEGQYPDIDWKTDGVLPKEFQSEDYYTRAGTHCNLGEGAVEDPNAPHKRTDFCDLRDFDTSKPTVLDNLIKVFQYWIALTDCDGFRIDTTKHVTWDQASDFCGAIKEYAQSIGKDNFFLVAEVIGDDPEAYYLNTVGQNLSAMLDLGKMKELLRGMAKGFGSPKEYFDYFHPEGKSKMGTHRNMRNRHVSLLGGHDDHERLSYLASSDLQVVAGTAFQLFTLGIPCIYYGTEQAFAGGFDYWRDDDFFTREAMFGPSHPRKSGKEGLTKFEDTLPGFGPFGTSGYHCFDETHPAYKRIAALIAVRQNPKYKVLRKGRQYQRETATDLQNLDFKKEEQEGKLVAWARVILAQEYVCVVNSNGIDQQSAAVLVDAKLSPPGSKMYVIANTEEVGYSDYAGSYPVGTAVTVKQSGDKAYIEILDIKPSEVIILANHQ
jgi:glycosidase